MSNQSAALPAFPVVIQPAGGGISGGFHFSGLSKREYAAIEIMKALAQGTPRGFLPSVEDAVRLADNLFNTLAATEPKTK